MELLLFLASRPGKVFSTDELLIQLWPNKVVTDGTVYNTLAELRNALATSDDTQTYIQNIPKKGYRLVAPVVNAVVRPQRSEPPPAADLAESIRIFRRSSVVVSGLAVTALLFIAVLVANLTGRSLLEDENQGDADPVRRLTIELPRKLLDFRATYSPVIISKDGRHIVFSGEQETASLIFTRPIDDFQVTAVEGTQRSAGVLALSPDSNWVAFVDLVDGLLKKVPISGGVPVTLCDPGGKIWSMTWGPDGNIVYASSAHTGLMRIASSGGVPSQLTTPEHGAFHKHPNFLADGSALFFTVGERGSTSRKTDRISVLSLESGEEKDLIEGASPQAAHNDFLVYYRDGTLLAAKFNSDSLEITSESVPIVNNVHYEDLAHFSLSTDGTLVYVVDANLKPRNLVWVDRNGAQTTIPIEPRPFAQPRISLDGERIAVVVDDIAGADLWLYTLRRGTMSRLTNDESREANPVWSHDGSFIVYSSNRVDDLFRVTTDGTTSVEQLTDSDKYQFAYSITPDDRQILFAEGSSNTFPSDIALLTLDSGEPTKVLLNSEFKEFHPAISPDGHWLAYVSDRTGGEEVYVQPFPNLSGAATPISIGGGIQPRWSPDGRELVYRGPSDLMITDITTEPEFQAGRPEPVLSLDGFSNYDLGNFDISPDGKRFLMVKSATDSDFPVSRVVIVQNWLDHAAKRIASR
jgi:Tol biopolymer transport system component